VRRRPDQVGAATVLVTAMAGVLMLLGAALAVVTAMVVAHRVAQSAADLAALAGARGVAAGGDGCEVARQIATANGARLTSCAVSGRVVDVEVVAPGPHWLGQTADLSARSRAGPAP
jgi:secretion/DNA translocation related TadE-like protein